ncbi:MAG: hypothetical protein IJF67_09835, partial [Clostridia bacterium]|nr:hypothetical protein [Clostridia bacterium]
MPMHPLFDLHCDTLYECLQQEKSLTDNDLNLSFDRLAGYGRFAQVLAMWSDHRLTEEEAWQRFGLARDLLAAELAKNPAVRLCTSNAEL